MKHAITKNHWPSVLILSPGFSPPDATAPVDITELTWEQKEKVLRSLFAMMNGLSKGGGKSSSSSAIPSPSILDPAAHRRRYHSFFLSVGLSVSVSRCLIISDLSLHLSISVSLQRIPAMKPLQHLAIEPARRGEGNSFSASRFLPFFISVLPEMTFSLPLSLS